MRKIDNKISAILSLVCLCLFSNGSFGQIKFNDQFLKTQTEIAASTKYSTITDFMKTKNYVLDSKEKEDDNSEYFIFLGNFKQMVIVAYSKNKELMYIKSNLLTLQQVFCEDELENNNFKNLSTENVEFDGQKIAITKWGNKDYPHRFEFEKSDDKICWLYLLTKAAEEY